MSGLRGCLPSGPVPRRQVHAEQASSLPSFCTLQKPQYRFGGSFLTPPPPFAVHWLEVGIYAHRGVSRSVSV